MSGTDLAHYVSFVFSFVLFFFFFFFSFFFGMFGKLSLHKSCYWYYPANRAKYSGPFASTMDTTGGFSRRRWDDEVVGAPLFSQKKACRLFRPILWIITNCVYSRAARNSWIVNSIPIRKQRPASSATESDCFQLGRNKKKKKNSGASCVNCKSALWSSFWSSSYCVEFFFFFFFLIVISELPPENAGTIFCCISFLFMPSRSPFDDPILFDCA